MDPNTVRTYHRLFSEGGLEKLLTRHHLGGTPRANARKHIDFQGKNREL